MKICTLEIKRGINLILALPLLVLAFDPVDADSRVVEPDLEDAQENLPYLQYLPKISVEPTGDATYYISPNGSDSRSGLSEAEAWATFDRAWQNMHPGDTLILMDGLYKQSLNPSVGGVEGKPITIKAQHDGKAIIDGEGKRDPVILRNYRGASHLIIEGIVAKNGNLLDGNGNVIQITTDHNILRRISAYDASPDANSAVIRLGGEYNLLEDCVARGTGRKMIMIRGDAPHNTIRGCFADWQSWDGREWHDCWPWGDGIEVYNSSNNIIENSISYSRNPTKGFNILAQGSNGKSNGNKILGSMSVLAGMYEDGTPYRWGDTRPQPTQYTCIRNYSWPGTRVGFNLTSSSETRDNLWQDIFSWGSAAYGFAWHGDSANVINDRINHATIIHNGLDDDVNYGGKDAADTSQEILDNFVVEDSRIDRIFQGYVNGDKIITSMSGEGARLTNRYVDGVLTNEPLWPWPMEERIQAELGISVTEMMTNLIFGTSNLDVIYPKVESSTVAENR